MEKISILKTLSKHNSEIRLAYVLLFMFIFSTFNYAQTCGTFGTYLKNGVCVPDVLINIAVVVMLVSLSIAAILLGIGIAFEHTKLISWSKDLLFQLLGSAVILAIYLSIVSILNFWAPNLLAINFANPATASIRMISGPVDGTWSSLQNHAEYYVNDCLLKYSKKAIKNMLDLTVLISMIGSSSVNLASGSYSQFMPLFPTGGGLISISSIAMGMVATIIMQLKLQLEILQLWQGLFNIVLPIGLIFRSFPYTRQAGAAMIAITIGFTIFLPLFYLLIEDITYNALGKNICTISPPKINIGKFVSMAYQAAKDSVLEVIEDAFGQGGWGYEIVYVMVIPATILPLMAYLIVLNITKRIAELLGGEIDFSTLVRLI